MNAARDTNGAGRSGYSPTQPPNRLRSTPMRIMARILSERKGLFAANLGLRLFKDLLPFQGPILVGIAVDLLSGTDRSFIGYEFTHNTVRSIVIVASLMAVLALAETVIGYIHTIVAAHMGRHVVKAARRDLAEASMQMALDERRRFNSGDLLDRCLADSKGLRGFTQDVIIRVISNTARAVYPLTLMFVIDPVMAMIVLAVIPLQSGFSALLQRRLQRQTRIARSREAEHTSVVKEAIDGWNAVASVGGQEWAARGINETAAASEDAKLIKKHTTAAISAVITLCTATGIAACYAVGGWRIITSGALSGGDAASGALTLGALTTFVGVAKKTYAPFRAYTKIVSNYRTGLVNLERIAEVLDAPMIDPRTNGPELKIDRGTIELDNVTFTYNEDSTPTLQGLTGSIPGRSLTVITGSSGAGKTTLLRLLLGLDVPDSGSVSIDGQDINKAKLSSVQRAIVLVPQQPMLFTGTIEENLLLGLEDVSAQQLIEACASAGLVDVLRELPRGLDTPVGSGRQTLSGGQLRRLAIARALLRKPAVLLLDEPTTGLDSANSSQVLDTLRRIGKDTTVVMVSHRRDPLEASDHHLVLSDGDWSVATMTEDAASTGNTSTGSGGNGTSASPAAVPAAAANGFAPANGHRATRPLLAANRHTPVEHRVLGLSAMGRPIVGGFMDADGATLRVLLVSGLRAGVRPIGAIAPAVLAQVKSDDSATVALGVIEDLNPDGDWASGRHTVLGVALASDQRSHVAVETGVFRAALSSWRPGLVIDVAERPAGGLSGGVHADVDIRFRPTSTSDAPEHVAALGAAVRRLLDTSRYEFRVSLVGCEPGSLTDIDGLTVIEITTTHTRDGAAAQTQAVIEAVVAGYRSFDATQAIPAAVD